MSSPERYQKVFSRMWTDKKFKSLSDDAKLLFNYFLSSPHSNLLGYYICPDGYIMADLSWDTKRLPKPLGELLAKQFIKRCADTFLTLVINHLNYNPIQNPNQVKSAIEILDGLPESCLDQDLIIKLNQLDRNYLEPLVKQLRKRLAKQLPKGYAKPETETETETEIKDLSPEPPQNGFDINSLAALWNDFKPLELSKVNIPLTRKPKDIQKIKDQLKRNPDKSFWQETILSIHNSKFLLGKNDRQWKATFDFVVDHANEIADGKYIDTPISTGNSKQINCLNHPERKAVYLNYFGQNLCQECKDFSEKLRNKNKSQELRV